MLDLEHSQLQDKGIHIYKVIIEDILKDKFIKMNFDFRYVLFKSSILNNLV
jgi:hypothetical protein